MSDIIGNTQELGLLDVVLNNELYHVVVIATANFKYSMRTENLAFAFLIGLTDVSLKAVRENCQELEKLDMLACTSMTSKVVNAIAKS